MPVDQDYTAFRKYVGDMDSQQISTSDIDTYLNDATVEATAVHITPDVTEPVLFDNLDPRYKPEVILLGTINWWWNKVAIYSDRITTTVGQASEQATDRWNHAMQILQSLQSMYDDNKVLGQDPDMGNLSHWDRNTLTRVGGRSEEDAKKAFIPSVS